MKYYRGFSLIETLVVLALIAVVLVVISHTLLAMSRSFTAIVRTRALVSASTNALERLTREARSASGVNAASVLVVDPSLVVLDTLDEGGAPTTVTFSVSAGTLIRTEGGTTASLTPATITVESFVVRPITTTASEGIKIDFTTTHPAGSGLTTTLHDTIILRGSY